MFKRTQSIFTITWLTTAVFFAADVPLLPLQQIAQQSKNLLPAPAGGPKAPEWQSSITFGINMARGNTDTTLINGRLETQWHSQLNECLLGLDGSYGEDTGAKNSELLHLYGQYNHFFSKRFYGFFRLDGLHDGIKDIRYRLTVSPGVGYYVLQQTNLTLATEAGPSMVMDRQGNHTDIYAAARLAERLEYKLTANTRIWESAEILPEIDKPSNFVANGELGMEMNIIKSLNFRVYVQDSFVSHTAPGYKNNDVRLMSGVSYKF